MLLLYFVTVVFCFICVLVCLYHDVFVFCYCCILFNLYFLLFVLWSFCILFHMYFILFELWHFYILLLLYFFTFCNLLYLYSVMFFCQAQPQAPAQTQRGLRLALLSVYPATPPPPPVKVYFKHKSTLTSKAKLLVTMVRP